MKKPALQPSAETLEFLAGIGQAWGQKWMLTLAREIKAGTFTHLDGEACMEYPTPAPLLNRQMTLEGDHQNGHHRPTPMQGRRVRKGWAPPADPRVLQLPETREPKGKMPGIRTGGQELRGIPRDREVRAGEVPSMIELTLDEDAWGADVGARRQAMAEGRGLRDTYGAEMAIDPMGFHVLGAKGELVVCIALGVEWDAYVGTDLTRPDIVYKGRELEIRTRKHISYELPVRPASKDYPGRILILVVCLGGRRYQILGWLEADEARRLSVEKEFVEGRGKARVVAQEDLHEWPAKWATR